MNIFAGNGLSHMCCTTWQLFKSKSTAHQPTWYVVVQLVDAMDWVIFPIIGIEVLAHKLYISIHFKLTAT